MNISCGWGHNIAIDNYGEIYSWGYGKNGALGHAQKKNVCFPQKIEYFTRKNIQISSADCGSHHTGIISTEGRLYMCGANHTGQLGLPIKECYCEPVEMQGISNKIKQVACGVIHSLFLTDKNQVFSAGGNAFGQLGLGNKINTSTPRKINELENVIIEKVACGHHSAALSKKGELFIWGTSSFGVYLTPHIVTSISAHIADIEFGGCFGVALDDNSNLWTWGSNTSGELGLGDYEPRSTPSIIPGLSGKSIADICCGTAFAIAIVDKPQDRLPKQIVDSGKIENRKKRKREAKSVTKISQKIPGQIHKTNRGTPSEFKERYFTKPNSEEVSAYGESAREGKAEAGIKHYFPPMKNELLDINLGEEKKLKEENEILKKQIQEKNLSEEETKKKIDKLSEEIKNLSAEKEKYIFFEILH